MCQLFAHQPQRDYESQTRSLRIDGHCTSIRLEMAFWDTLEEIASKEDMSLAKFLTRLHSEVLDHCGEVHNFASLLHCSMVVLRWWVGVVFFLFPLWFGVFVPIFIDKKP